MSYYYCIFSNLVQKVISLTKLFANERRMKILELLQKKQRATVKELSEAVHASEATLRTDLNIMEQEGLLIRTHGGAMIDDTITNANLKTEHTFVERERKNRDQKMLIGMKAFELIQNRQCILLDASSTALELAKILKDKNIRLTVVTNGINAALELKENPSITVILLGGMLRMGSVAVEGTLGSQILNQINIDAIFTSARGFTIEDGLTDFNVYEVELKKKMIQSASKVIALLDHTKIGKSSLAGFAETEQIHAIVTDNQTPTELILEIEKKNIEVIIA